MAEELLEKIPPENRWAITARTLWRFIVLRGDKIIAPLLGTAKDIISPLWSKEKWYEINDKIWGDGGRYFYPWAKETFNIPVEDAIGAAKLLQFVEKLVLGPEQESEIIEKSRERVVIRRTKCTLWERYEEFEAEPEFRACDTGEEL